MPDSKEHKSALKVMKGISQPSQINEEAASKIRSHKTRLLTTQEYLEGIFSGNRTILSKAITLIESNLPAHQEKAQEVIGECLRRGTWDVGRGTWDGGRGTSDVGRGTGEEGLTNGFNHPSSDIEHRTSNIEHSVSAIRHPVQQVRDLRFTSTSSIRIGVTGVPGVGKSTFIEALGKYLTARGHKVAVLAIDPSSTKSKGSILGDKTRMEALAIDPDAFIRPSPSAGSLGGVARKTRETIILCEAAGYDVIFVETIGVGQSETAVHSMTDFFLLLMLAGAGDELQGIKRGIIEMADALFINKADGDNIEQAKIALSQLNHALHYFPPAESGWTPVVRLCSSKNGEGIGDVWKVICDYMALTIDSGYFHKKRAGQNIQILHDAIDESLRLGFFSRKDVVHRIRKAEEEIREGRISPYEATRKLLENYPGPGR